MIHFLTNINKYNEREKILERSEPLLLIFCCIENKIQYTCISKNSTVKFSISSFGLIKILNLSELLFTFLRRLELLIGYIFTDEL